MRTTGSLKERPRLRAPAKFMAGSRTGAHSQHHRSSKQPAELLKVSRGAPAGHEEPAPMHPAARGPSEILLREEGPGTWRGCVRLSWFPTQLWKPPLLRPHLLGRLFHVAHESLCRALGDESGRYSQAAVTASADSGSPPRTDEAGPCFSAPGAWAWSWDALVHGRVSCGGPRSQFPSLRVSPGGLPAVSLTPSERSGAAPSGHPA